jgi:malate dehydrogenase
MKISVIGAGNVGSLTAMRLAHESLGQIVLVDVLKGMACGKAFDLEDARPLLKSDYLIQGSDDISLIKDSNIVVMTAGLARKPGMTREELQNKNAAILKEVISHIKELAPDSILIIVTNPLDIMTDYALRASGFGNKRVFGMGISLDGARFANLIANKLSVACSQVEAVVIGGHGEAMLPLPRLSKVKGVSLSEFFNEKEMEELVKQTFDRGAQIVSLLGSGSAFFAPSAAISCIVKSIVKDEKRTIGVCACLEGEYGIENSCVGVPCRIGKNGIEQIVELDLTDQELDSLRTAAQTIKSKAKQLPS